MTLYTMDNCVYCDMLKLRLQHEQLSYQEIKDQSEIESRGFETVPQLQVSGQTMDFNQAIAWLNSREEA